MAQTYTIAEALNLVSGQIRKDIEPTLSAYLANIAQNAIWNRYDWRETIADLPPFYIIGHEQDFGPPAVIVPSDFLGLREAYLVSTSATPSRRRELKVRRDLRATGTEALPDEISYEPAKKRFRVYPRVPGGVGATDWLIDGTYKIRPTKITANTLQTTLIPFDDLYFQVFCSALKWVAWDTAGDQRAGAVNIQNGRPVYTGQLGVMHDQIDQMAESEGLNLGDPDIAPTEPLVYPGGYYGNFLGLG